MRRTYDVRVLFRFLFCRIRGRRGDVDNPRLTRQKNSNAVCVFFVKKKACLRLLCSGCDQGLGLSRVRSRHRVNSGERAVWGNALTRGRCDHKGSADGRQQRERRFRMRDEVLRKVKRPIRAGCQHLIKFKFLTIHDLKTWQTWSANSQWTSKVTRSRQDQIMLEYRKYYKYKVRQKRMEVILQDTTRRQETLQLYIDESKTMIARETERILNGE